MPSPEANYGAIPLGVQPLPPDLQKITSLTIKDQEVAYPLEKRVEPQTADALHLMIISNVNYGSKFCDVEMFERHMQIAKECDNAKIIFLGNLISNPPGRNVHTDIKSPGEQIDYIKGWIDRLDAKGKVLAAARSDYPVVSIRSEERIEDVNDVLYQGVSFPVLQNGGIVEVPFVDEDAESGLVYKIALYSKSGTSRPAATKSASAQRAFLLKVGGNADIVAVSNPYIADVTQAVRGNPPTRQEVTPVTSGGYLGNVTGERPDLTVQPIRDKFGIDGHQSGQVITLFRKFKDTRVYLRPEHFAYDYAVDALTNELDSIRDAGKEADFYRSLTQRGVRLTAEDKKVIFQDHNAINKILAEQQHPQRRRE